MPKRAHFELVLDNGTSKTSTVIDVDLDEANALDHIREYVGLLNKFFPDVSPKRIKMDEESNNTKISVPCSQDASFLISETSSTYSSSSSSTMSTMSTTSTLSTLSTTSTISDEDSSSCDSYDTCSSSSKSDNDEDSENTSSTNSTYLSDLKEEEEDELTKNDNEDMSNKTYSQLVHIMKFDDCPNEVVNAYNEYETRYGKFPSSHCRLNYLLAIIFKKPSTFCLNFQFSIEQMNRLKITNDDQKMLVFLEKMFSSAESPNLLYDYLERFLDGKSDAVIRRDYAKLNRELRIIEIISDFLHNNLSSTEIVDHLRENHLI